MASICKVLHSRVPKDVCGHFLPHASAYICSCIHLVCVRAYVCVRACVCVSACACLRACVRVGTGACKLLPPPPLPTAAFFFVLICWAFFRHTEHNRLLPRTLAPVPSLRVEPGARDGSLRCRALLPLVQEVALLVSWQAKPLSAKPAARFMIHRMPFAIRSKNVDPAPCSLLAFEACRGDHWDRHPVVPGRPCLPCTPGPEYMPVLEAGQSTVQERGKSITGREASRKADSPSFSVHSYKVHIRESRRP